MTSAGREQLLDRSAWRDPAAYDRWMNEAHRMAAELRRTTGRADLPPFGRWLREASPGWPWQYRHLKAVRRALRRIESGESRNLMIFLHPRSFKSQMVTVRYPAYLLERDPMTRVIVACYNQDLAESFSRQTLAIVRERGVSLNPARQAVNDWLTAAGGGLRAIGVGGGVTGFGTSCFVGETPVLTERGPVRIDELARMERPPVVLAVDVQTMTAEYRPVVAARESIADELVEIVTGGDRVIRCTPEHPIYTPDGYKSARHISERDELFVMERQGRWEAVAGIRRIRTEGVPVYDIQVEGHHNFFAGQILAHNCLLIDDPVKSYEEAHSRAYQARVWNWWQNDLTTRLEPHPRDKRPASVILTMTRWSDNDLAGRILNSEGGGKWEVLRIPALAETQEERDSYNASIGREPGEADPLRREPGEAMNPERYDAADLAEKRTDQGLTGFMALYQQRPTAPQGDMFRREWFEIIDAAAFDALATGTPGRRAVRYWDKAGTAGGGAMSAGVLMAEIGGMYYVVHTVMGQWGAADREQIILQTAAADFAVWGYDVETVVEQEPGSGGKESAENTIRALTGYRAAADRPTGDKALRAEPLAAQASVGRVKIVAGTWNRDYLDLVAAFPGGTYKDAVDASSGAFARLSATNETRRPAAGKARVTRREELFG